MNNTEGESLRNGRDGKKNNSKRKQQETGKSVKEGGREGAPVAIVIYDSVMIGLSRTEHTQAMGHARAQETHFLFFVLTDSGILLATPRWTETDEPPRRQEGEREVRRQRM